jgi:hypothetical protein
MATKLIPDLSKPEPRSDGSILYWTYGKHNRALAQIDNCLCADGERRRVCITGIPDTSFAIPAITYIYVKALKQTRTVSGYAAMVEGTDYLIFKPHKHGENAWLVPTKEVSANGN